MSEPVPPTSKNRSPVRRVLNWAWVILGVLLAVEVAAFVYTRQREANRHNANINRIKSMSWERTGKIWHDLDGDHVRFVVFHRAGTGLVGNTINQPTVDLDYPFSAGKVWLNLSRTERELVYDGQPQVLCHIDGAVTRFAAPARLNEADLRNFTRSAFGASGEDGIKQWLASLGLTSPPE